MGEGWLFMRVLVPRICVRHAISCENRGCAHDCLFLPTPHRTNNKWRVYWARPASLMMLVSGLGINNHARDMAKFAFLHFSIPATVTIPIHESAHRHFTFLFSPHPSSPFLSLQYEADAQIKQHRLAAAVIDRFDAITTIRYAMPRHVLSLCFPLSGQYNLSLS